MVNGQELVNNWAGQYQINTDVSGSINLVFVDKRRREEKREGRRRKGKEGEEKRGRKYTLTNNI